MSAECLDVEEACLRSAWMGKKHICGVPVWGRGMSAECLDGEEACLRSAWMGTRHVCGVPGRRISGHPDDESPMVADGGPLTMPK